MTCPRSHSKTVLLGLKSTNTPCCTRLPLLHLLFWKFPPPLETSPPQFPLLEAARTKRCLPYHSLLGQKGKKEEGRLVRRWGSHGGSHLHELVIAWFPELLAGSACRKGWSSCGHICRRNSLKCRDDAIFLPAAATAGQVLEAHFGFVPSLSEVHVFRTAVHTAQNKTVRQGGL